MMMHTKYLRSMYKATSYIVAPNPNITFFNTFYITTLPAQSENNQPRLGTEATTLLSSTNILTLSSL